MTPRKTWLLSLLLVTLSPGLSRSEAPSKPASTKKRACSAQGLSATPATLPKALPPAVESMRRRIIAAAVACDYAALAALGDEQGKGLTFSFGPDEDVAALWRQQEAEGSPTLAQLVKLLNLPFYEESRTEYDPAGDRKIVLYAWPRAAREQPTPKDFADLKKVFTTKELESVRLPEDDGGGYVGLRIGISREGDWQYAISGD